MKKAAFETIQLDDLHHLRHRISSSGINRLIEKMDPLKGPRGETRDHLANERTFLAYIRTGVNLILLGLEIVQLSKFCIMEPTESIVNIQGNDVVAKLLRMRQLVSSICKPAYYTCFVFAILTMTLGVSRYFFNYTLLEPAMDEFASGSIFTAFIFAGIVIIAGLLMTFIVKL